MYLNIVSDTELSSSSFIPCVSHDNPQTTIFIANARVQKKDLLAILHLPLVFSSTTEDLSKSKGF